MTDTPTKNEGASAPRYSQWNKLRARLEAGEPVLGLTITTGNLEAAVLCAKQGFHFLWIEMEHSATSLASLRAIALGASGLDVSILTRVPVTAAWTAKRVLDQGAHGVIFPFVSDPELAAVAARACRYPLAGSRGSGAGLAATTWPEDGNYYDSADANVLTVAIVEEAKALPHVDAIAATPGIDVLFIGVSDLSFSLGLRGRQDEPVLQQAIDSIVAAAKRHGKFLGRPATSPEDILRFGQQGFQFFHTVTELGLMCLGAEQILKPLGLGPSSPRMRILY